MTAAEEEEEGGHGSGIECLLNLYSVYIHT